MDLAAKNNSSWRNFVRLKKNCLFILCVVLAVSGTTVVANDVSGTGCGIEKDDGKILVKSKPGEGSKFTFTLPNKKTSV